LAALSNYEYRRQPEQRRRQTDRSPPDIQLDQDEIGIRTLRLFREFRVVTDQEARASVGNYPGQLCRLVGRPGFDFEPDAGERRNRDDRGLLGR